MPSPRIQYFRGHYEALTPGQRQDIDGLTRQSVQLDFPGLTAAQVNHFAKQSAKGRHNLASQVRSGTLRGGQSFGRALSLIVLHEGKPAAHLTIADNVSSGRPWPISVAEREMKMYRDEARGGEALRHRFAWFGYAAMAPAIRQAVMEAHAQGRAHPLDVLLAVGLDTRQEVQPVVAYPWDQEQVWQTAVAGAGLELQAGEDATVYPFGRPQHSPAVHQDRWLAAERTDGPHSALEVQQLIMAKEAGERLVAEARRSVA